MIEIFNISDAESFWMILAVFFLLLEFISHKFIIFFLSIASFISSIVNSLVFLSTFYQMLIFSLMSVLSIMLFRESVINSLGYRYLFFPQRTHFLSQEFSTTIAASDSKKNNQVSIKLDGTHVSAYSKDHINKGDLVKIIVRDKDYIEIELFERDDY